jgi:hypothetical protein
MFIVVTGDPLDDDCEVLGPFKTERAARAVAAAGSRGEEEWTAVALEAPEQGASDGTAVVFRGFVLVPGAYEPGVGGAMEAISSAPSRTSPPRAIGPSPTGSTLMPRSSL